jgi:uracil-DNA glycosylase
MIWSKFANQFAESWWLIMKPFIESKDCDEIYKFLKETSGKGIKIAPLSSNTFRTFLDTSLDDLKCVVIGRGPYARFEEDSPIATGVLFGSSINIQFDFVGFYEGIENELFNGLNLEYIKTTDTEFLSQQGVLLLNNSLTVEKDKENSHEGIWDTFIIHVLNNIPTDIPILLLGESNERFEGVINDRPFRRISYPVMGNKWETEGVFTGIGKYLWENEGESINWLFSDCPF